MLKENYMKRSNIYVKAVLILILMENAQKIYNNGIRTSYIGQS